MRPSCPPLFYGRIRAGLVAVTVVLSACAPAPLQRPVLIPRFQITAAEGGPGRPVPQASSLIAPPQPVTESGGPVIAPTVSDKPPVDQRPAEQPTPAPSRGGGGSGGGSQGPRMFAGQVVDRQGHPVAGATVLFASGASGQSGADGRFQVVASQASLPASVFAPGYAASTLTGDELPAVLHVERLASADPDFEGGAVTVRGAVSWPEAPPAGALVSYTDDLGSVANPVVTDAEGNFALRISLRRAGRPNGMFVALAQTGAGTRMIGLSATFSPTEQGADPVAVPAVVADRAVAFAVGAPPPTLPIVRHQLEIARGELEPFRIQTPGTTSGTYQLPAPGALAATLRIAVDAADEDRNAVSLIALDPYALPAAPPDFLALPTLTVTPATRRVAWTLPTASTRVHLSLAQQPHPQETYWEAWFEDRAAHDFAAAEWPTGASATARLVAYEGSAAATRHVASASQLRLVPSAEWAEAFRSAEVRTGFTP